LAAAAADMPVVLAAPALEAAQDAGVTVGWGVETGGVVFVGVAVGVTLGVSVTLGVTLGMAVVGVSDGVWLVLGKGAAFGSSSEQALRASAASSSGAATRVRRAVRIVPRGVMAPTVTGVADVTQFPRAAVANRARDAANVGVGDENRRIEHEPAGRHTPSLSFAAPGAQG